MLGKIFVGVIVIFLLLGVFATSILDGIKTWRTDGTTTQTALVTTAGGATSTNVTLTKDLYQASVAEVSSITSNDGDDTPVADTYTEATQVLLVTGLAESTTRTLTIVYYGETDSSVMQAIGPFLGILIIGGILFAVVYSVFHKSGRRG